MSGFSGPIGNYPSPDQILHYVNEGIRADLRTVAVIGSYTIEAALRPGSDIDIIVAVGDLDTTLVRFEKTVYKPGVAIRDSMGERIEINTPLNGTTLDVTIIDEFNTPNNPLTDAYENALGSCYHALTLSGMPLRDLFGLDDKIREYDAIRTSRLAIVEAKIASTKQKVVEQDRTDLHIIYELQKYIFIRECIRRKTFNRLSIKHPEQSIPDFDSVFADELATCGLTLAIGKLGGLR